MKKLNLDGLRVDSFATASDVASIRGTVLGMSATCAISYNGTCYVTCYMTCFETCEGCETDPNYCR